MVTVGTTMAHTEDPPPSPALPPPLPHLPNPLLIQCHPAPLLVTPRRAVVLRALAVGWGPIPPRPPPAPRRLHILFTRRPGPWGCPIPPPREDSSTHNVTTSPRVGPRTPAVSPHPLGGTQRGGGEGAEVWKVGGGKAANLPHACNQSNQPQLPAGRRTGLHSPLWERGDGRRMHKHPPTQNTPGCPPGRAAPPPQPPPCSPPAPHGLGARRQRVPKAERRAEQRAERSPPPSEQEETPPHVPPLGSGSVLTSPRAGGGPWAARCPPVLQP